jgi:hypothetical protein
MIALPTTPKNTNEVDTHALEVFFGTSSCGVWTGVVLGVEPVRCGEGQELIERSKMQQRHTEALRAREVSSARA